MRSVYALLVGISEYSPPVTRLFGCVNDVQQIDGVFRELFSDTNAYQYLPKIIVDAAATRDAIINGFSIFDAAKSNDICIFYYSGHGSLVKTNPVFWNDGSEYLNSLVCYDSRLAGGYDLVDKELAYLVWKTTVNKPELHFVSVMDCCFAGGNLRDVTEIRRMFARNESVKNITDFLGYESFVNGVPPRGRYVAISASQPYQTSKEKIISGDRHGIFTWFLCQSLQQKLPAGGYTSLLDRVRILTVSNSRDQVPMLEAYGMDTGTEVFGVQSLPAAASWSLFYQAGWKINKGAIHGVKPGLQLMTGNDDTIIVTAVNTTESTVTVGANIAKEIIYDAYPKTTIPVTLNFFIDDPGDTLRPLLEATMSAKNYEGIQFTTDRELADFVIRYNQSGRLCMTDTAPLSLPRFSSVHINSPEVFLSRLQHVARWASVANLSNPQGSGYVNDLVIELYAVENNTTTRIADPSKHIFRYINKNGRYVQPDFRLLIKNNRNRMIHASVLYCGCDFAVSNELLQDYTIDPGISLTVAFTEEDGTRSSSIPISIPREYRDVGIRKITDFIVLLFSEVPIPSADLCLTKLPLENRVLKGVGQAGNTVPDSNQPKIIKPVWGTVRIPIQAEI